MYNDFHQIYGNFNMIALKTFIKYNSITAVPCADVEQSFSDVDG